MQKVFLSTCALFLFVLMACSQETNPTTPGASLANDNPPVASQTQAHDLSKQTRGGVSSLNANRPASAKAASPELPCSGTTITFTTDGSGVSGSSGSGTSRQGAITNTIENAIIDDILGQFSCAL
ncbi:MAG: hypothetical protein HKN21_07800, partial [Candidatus Eisenbacteria bacterium]|nr:hypothetical protein [Candidatus Eisenbacteria bacterium]